MKFYKAMFFLFVLVAAYWHARVIWTIFFRGKTKKKVVQQPPEKATSDIEPDTNDSQYLDHLIGIEIEQKADIKERMVERKTLNNLLDWNQLKKDEHHNKMVESMKQEAILREALKDTKKEIRKEAATA